MFTRLGMGLMLALTLLTLPALAEPGEVAHYRLDNGMEVVVIPDRRAPVVTHMVWYRVGSADEPAGKSGIAHFLEHLMFKGTELYAAGEFSRRVSEIGGEENAFTSNDYTAYYQRVAPEALATMMTLEADRMRNLVLTEDMIATERDVVLEERRARVENNPGALLGEEVEATLYQNHPYRVPVIGWMHEIAELNRADAIAFYHRYYAPNNAALIVAGDVEPEVVLELARQTYGAILANPDLPPRIRPREPEQNTRRTVSLHDARVTVPSLRMQWVVPSYGTAEPGRAEAFDLLSEILGGGTRSRLYQELVVRRGIAQQASAYYRGTALDDSTFVVSGSPRGDAPLEEIETAISEEIRRIATDGVDASELERARNRFIRNMIFARDSQTTMAQIYGSTLTTGGTVADVSEWPDRIRSVDAEAVRAAARELVPSRATIGYLLPPASEK